MNIIVEKIKIIDKKINDLENEINAYMAESGLHQLEVEEQNVPYINEIYEKIYVLENKREFLFKESKYYNKILNSLDKDSYNYKVLDFIIQNGSISSMDAFNSMNNTRLSSTIYELRKRYNVPIMTIREYTQDGRQYGVYCLMED